MEWKSEVQLSSKCNACLVKSILILILSVAVPCVVTKPVHYLYTQINIIYESIKDQTGINPRALHRGATVAWFTHEMAYAVSFDPFLFISLINAAPYLPHDTP